MERMLALDLKLARVASGLSGKDLAHLLGCTKERISRLENANARIHGHEISQLFLIYGQEPFELLYHVHRKTLKPLFDRLRDMPEPSSGWELHAKARNKTITETRARLEELNQTFYEA